MGGGVVNWVKDNVFLRERNGIRERLHVEDYVWLETRDCKNCFISGAYFSG